MFNFAIIPARGGSKRIPGKNVKFFLGKPIICYSVEVAISSGLFDEVMVSTDDPEIAEVALACGAKVPFLRSPETSNDFAPLADVIDEVKEEYLGVGRSFDNICCILPTAPLITVENLRKGYELLIEKGADSVRPLVRFGYAIERALKLNDGRVEMLHPEHKYTRSQDLEPAFHDAGQFYWMKAACCLRGDNRFGFEISEVEAQDIDTEIDWKMAELKYQYLNQLGRT
ncbi:MAG: pseudaminic acid cytidylyltransferase [Zoogloea sp.]|uniref:pseudaminic acid cytidylyltransferase n=1 Tax=Zoogloea sp. TaxID=49181 RepID=UPI002615A98D|nr:pseudaminic acid cytidylyltransferase [Zoogloea sp.]MDD3326655.1 pseudaminic acid cytidylyltransferase [Zoogloea sp.]